MMNQQNISKKLKIAASQFIEEKEYWEKKLSGNFERVCFPYDPGKPGTEQNNLAVATFGIRGELFERMTSISGGSLPKLHMLLAAGVTALLARYTGSRDIIVGTPIDRQDSENDLINKILPLRVRIIPGNMTFKELLLEVKNVINEAIDNQNFPIETLTPSLEMFDVMILLENIQERSYVEHIQTSIIFLFRRAEHEIEGKVEYNIRLYREDSINRIISHYLQFLRTSLFNVDLAINQIQLLSPEEKDELIRFNRTRADYPSWAAIHELIEFQAEKTPGNIALIDEKEAPAAHLFYGQLNQRAECWARYLVNRGIQPGAIIGILLEQSIEQVCAILAVLKSGSAYLPIDIDYPQGRKSYMLEDSGAALLITQSHLTRDLDWHGEIVHIQEIETRAYEPGTGMALPRVQPKDLAYVIYTSGSTGKPKGVAVEHRALVNYICWAAKNYIQNETVNFPLFTAPAFDLTVTSIFTPLITGNSIYIYRGEEKEFLVEKVFNQNKVEALKLTPVHLMFIADYTAKENDSKIKRLIVGGDQLKTQLARQIHDNFNGEVEIYNEYGPTEATVGCMIYKFDPQKNTGTSVPIGTPADNVQIYLLDENKKNVPKGGIGEIYIAGHGLARGYLNKPELTAEKFDHDLWDKQDYRDEKQKIPGKRIHRSHRSYKSYISKRLYKTGDMARRLADGNIDFLGRKDHQVKIRGYRIEIGEVEYYLSKFEGIEQAMLAAKDDERGYKYLVAYIVPDGKGEKTGIDPGELRSYLSKYLPEFMIPSYFVSLKRLPVTVNGKIDRKALPEPGKNTLDTGAQYLPPTTEMEKTMVGVWQDVMGVEKIGTGDSYFSLGGDSIKAIQIAARLQKFELKLELKDLFQYTTIKELAHHVKPMEKAAYQGIIEGEVQLTPIQHWFFEKNFSGEHHFNQAVMLYRPGGFREEIIKKVFYQLMKHHDALRMIFKREDGKIKQVNRDVVGDRELADLEVFDLHGYNEDNHLEEIIQEKCSWIQSRIDLGRGPLVKLGLFKTIGGDYLLIAIHHLVFDGLSWRILFEDFTSLYQQIERGVPDENWEIPLKTTSYKEWAKKLYHYSNSDELHEELEYWKNIESAGPLALTESKTNRKGKVKEGTQLFFELSEEYTEKLLKQANNAYNTEINDILLAALGLAFSDWRGVGKIPVILEGHGREEIIPGVDITRTVGWFTSVYPVILDLKNRDDLSSVIKDTKEMLRHIPCKGIGYGILKYLTEDENKKGIEYRLASEIGFNYLGQFDEDVNTGLFQIANISPGHSIGLNLERIYKFYIIGMVLEKKLRMSLNYDMNQFDEEEIRSLVDGYENRLKQIIDYCTSRKKTELTLSDFSASIDESEVEQVFAVLNEISPEKVIKKSDITDMYFLTPMQEGMLLHYLMDKTSPAYFEQMSYRIQGELNFKSFEQAYARIIDRYDVLRTRFIFEKVRQPLQVVLRNRNTSIYYEDISNPDAEETERQIEEFKFKDKKRGFDLLKDILIRLAILKITDQCYEIIWSFHHIIMDGWCTNILIKDLLILYHSLKHGKSVNLPPTVPYKNYIKWLEQQDKEKGIEYWVNYLAGYENQAIVPTSYGITGNSDGKENKYESVDYRFVVSQPLTRELVRLSIKNHSTISTIFQTMWGILLQKYNDINDVVFGSVVSGRPPNLEGIETMVGLLINTNPVRIENEPGETFVSLLKKIQSRMIQSKLYEFVPLSEIQSNTSLKRDLINHIVAFENYPLEKEIKNLNQDSGPGFFVESVETFEQTTYDLNVIAFLIEELLINIKYNSTTYNEHVIKRIETHFVRVIEQITVNPEILLEAIEIISAAEKQQILFDFNSTRAEYSKDKTMHLLFEEQVEKIPDHIAVSGPPTATGGIHESFLTGLIPQISYNELNKKANRLARELKKRCVQPNRFVSVIIDRSIEMVISVMAILKAGGAYVPLEPYLPEERLITCMSSLNAKWLLTNRSHLNKIDKITGKLPDLETIIRLDDPTAPYLKDTEKNSGENLVPVPSALDIAYVIFTSGTTGVPKGVVEQHKPVVNIIEWINEATRAVSRDKLLFVASLSFDLSVYDIFGILAAGASLRVVSSDELKSPEGLLKVIIREGITFWDSAPAALQQLVPFIRELKETGLNDIKHCLRMVLLSGDWIPLSLPGILKETFKGIRLLGLGGGTEATIWSNYYHIEEVSLDWPSIPYGKPIQNAKYYILDRFLKPRPIGLPGDLYIGGECLALGYINDIELTAVKFINNPFARGEKIYQTGDLARWFPDGNMEFLGRRDYQIKIRGYRIELGEIESQLLAHEHIREVVVIARGKAKDDKYLCAYYVSDNLLDSSQLNRYLSKTLPGYMIPPYFVNLDRMPLTPNGKIDRKAFPDPLDLEIGPEYTEPRDEIEKKMVEIWSGVLGIDPVDKPIGIDDNFFQLGGHSLKATILSSWIHKELDAKIPLADIFVHQTIRELANHLGKSTRHKHKYRTIEPVEKKEYYSLSSAQMRLAVLDKIEEKSTAYNIPIVLEFEGNLDILRLENAVKGLIRRHESLRTAFHVTRGKPVQVIYDRVPFDMEYYNENRITVGEENIKSIIHDRFIRPFDLSRAPLLRVGLIKIGEMKHLLMVDIHHIVCDGVGLDIFVRDISKIYTGESLPELGLQYKDYASWQLEMMESGKLGKEERYWLEKLSGEIPVLNLFTDYPRPPVQDFEGRVFTTKIQGELSQKIKNLSGENGATLYMTLLTGYNALLYKYTGQEDIIVGTPAAGRPHADLQAILGMFVNMLTMRSYPLGEKTFIQFLQEVKESALNAYANQDYQFEELVTKLDLKRDLSRNPLFDTVFTVQNTANRENRLPGLQLKPYIYGARTSKFDIDFNVYEPGEDILFNVYYCTKLFKNETIQQMCRHFINLLEEAVRFPEVKLHEIRMLSKVEEKRLLYEFNNTGADYPKDITIHQLFGRQVERTPDHTAVAGSSIRTFEKLPLHESSLYNLQITYRELNEKSDRLSLRLREKGVTADTIVGIKIERSTAMIIGILGILKAGGAYLPIDPDYPRERIDFMLNDSAARVLLTDAGNRYADSAATSFHLSFTHRGASMIPAEGEIHHPSSHGHFPGNLVYVIYTSGTTGKPKGVIMEHHSLVNRLNWMQKAYPLDERDTLLQKTTFTFDVSVWEIFWWALVGAKVCLLAHGGEKDPGITADTIEKHHPSVIHFVPSMLSVFLDYLKREGITGKLSSLKQVIASGEKLTAAQVRRFEEILGKIHFTKLANLYGPTEAAIDVSYYNCFETADLQEIPIGKPIDNIKLWIIDKHLHLQPIMVPGELCISGVGLARGYLNRLELTGEKFNHDLRDYRDYQDKNKKVPGKESYYPAAPSARHTIYRTGDLARWLPNGNIEFLGRIDHQVKIRGFRIECGEIEYELIRYKGIDEAVVIAGESEDGERKYLCAYIVPAEDIHMDVLREYLARKLPNYMIPHFFVTLENIPLTPNGKIDRAQLPEPGINIELKGEYIPPADKIQEKLVEIWQQVLDVEPVGIRDNYFHLGGDSIKAIALISAINNEFHSNLNMADIYINKTVEGLSLKLKEKDIQSDGELKELLPEIVEFKNKVLKIVDDPGNIEDVFPMSDIEMGMIFHYVKSGGEALYHDQILYQTVYKDFDIDRMRKALSLMMEKHPILRTAYHQETFAHIVYKNVTPDIPYHDIPGMDKPGKEAFIRRYMEESRGRSFDIQVAPLWRMSFFNPGIHNMIILLFETHHAIIDGWSNALLLTELNNTYLELKENPGYVPQKLKSGYKDYILQQMLEKKKSGTTHYWKNELSDYKRLNLLPQIETKKGKNEEKAEANIKTRDLGDQRRKKLENTARKYNTTLKHLCFAAYSLMLGMMSYENDILAGLVAHNRPLSEDGDKLIGCFLNTIPVRIKIPAHARWSDFFIGIDKKMLTLKQYDQLPLFEIVSLLGEKTGEGNPLFDTLFNFIDFHAYKQARVENNAETKYEDHQLNVGSFEKTNFPLNFTINALMDRFVTLIDYSEDIFNETYVGKLHGYFENILDQFTDNPEGIMDKVIIMSEVEKQELLYGFNDTQRDFPRGATIHQLLEEQVEKTPDHTALTGPSVVPTAEGAHPGPSSKVNVSPSSFVQITYRQLNEKAGRLAHLLIKMNVTPDTIVGIMAEHSVEMILGILGILKSGGAYLPIDPNYPQVRIEFMVKDSGARILLVEPEARVNIKTGAGAESMELHPLYDCFSSSPSPLASTSLSLPQPHHLAYIIYTSGSTGSPKGVMTQHRSVVNYTSWAIKHYVREESVRFPLFTSLSFDLTVTSIFTPLLSGNNIVVYRGKEKESLIEKVIEDNLVEVVKLTPSHLKLIVELIGAPFQSNIRRFIAGGEALETQLAGKIVEKFKGKIVIYNEYGPTEATVGCMIHTFCPETDTGASVPIGIPSDNTRVFILDNKRNPTPVGVIGELYISGDGVARGYVNQPELTAENFIALTLTAATGILYKTGDLARWRTDGNIEFFGRIDSQVKIRGFRVETGEIENRLLSHHGIKDAVVIVPKAMGAGHISRDTDNYLCAYIVPESPGIPSLSELREWLEAGLPAQMIPSNFVSIERIPLTPNGKIDKNALPGPGWNAGGEYEAPQDKIEKKLVEMWTEVLTGDETASSDVRIGRSDDFFMLGGHSLKAMRLISKIHKEFNVKVPLSKLFKIPTVAGLSKYIQMSSGDENIEVLNTSIEPVEKKEYYPLSSAQLRLYITQHMDLDSTAYNRPEILQLEGLLDSGRLEKAFRELIERHENLRVSFPVIGGKTMQRIHQEVEFDIQGNDLDTRNTVETPELIIRHFIRAFDLSKAPLLRVGLIKTGAERHILMIDIHHISSDGISQSILIKDFMALYRGRKLSQLKLQYKDFSEWQRKQLHAGCLKKQEEYWLNRFRGEIPVLDLTTDYPRPAVQRFEGQTIVSEIGEILTGELKVLAAEEEATLYIVLLAIFNILLSRFANQNDIIVGSPVAGRNYADLEQIVGMFINVLLMRNTVDAKKSFQDFLEDVKNNSLQAFDNQDYSIDHLAGQLDITRDASRNPLYEVIFAMLIDESLEFTIPGLELKSVKHPGETIKTDLRLGITEMDDKIIITITYSTTLFKRKTAEDMLVNYVEIIEQVLANKKIKLEDIKITHDLLTLSSNVFKEDLTEFTF